MDALAPPVESSGRESGVYLDEALLDYFRACAHDTPMDPAVDPSSEEDDRPSLWRATSGDSPLRGRARLRLHHRHSMQHLRCSPEEATAGGPAGRVLHRGPEARRAAAALVSPPTGGASSRDAMARPEAAATETWVHHRRPADAVWPEDLLFDVLSAVGQCDSASCVRVRPSTNAGPPVLWILRPEVHDALPPRGPAPLRDALDHLLRLATEVGEAAEALDAVDRWVAPVTAVAPMFAAGLADEAAHGGASTASAALGAAAYRAVGRFHAAAREALRHVQRVVLHALERQAGRRDGTGADSSSSSSTRCVSVTDLWLDLERAMELLRRYRTIWSQTRCFALLQEGMPEATGGDGAAPSVVSLEAFAERCVTSAATLVDYLTMRLGVFQDASRLDLYRFHLMLLVHTVWPYVECLTAALFGLVHAMQPARWRKGLPRLLRAPFSHLGGAGRSGGARMDILSLTLHCVGYADGASMAMSGPHPPRTSFSSASSSSAAASSVSSSSSPVTTRRRMEEDDAVESLRTARAYIVRTFLAHTHPPGAEAEERGDAAHRARSPHALPTILPLVFATAEAGCGGGAGASLSPASHWSLHLSEGTAMPGIELVETTETPAEVPWRALVVAAEVSASSRPHVRRVGGWVDVSVPATRWLTAALLLPMAQVVQRLQRGRLRRLFQAVSPAPGGDLALPALALDDALRLLVDVALCRDRERVVEGFLRSLHRLPHWWHRGGPATETSVGTACLAASAAFSDAMAGRPLGGLVRLVVLPRATEGPAAATAAGDLVETFAAFRLRFAFPAALRLVLLPRVLCRGTETDVDSVEKHSDALFWYHRGDSSAVDEDVWSHAFGYLCSLHYAHLTLRGRQKALHGRDGREEMVEAAEDASAARRCLRTTSRGLGSAYFALSFFVDSLLSFTQYEMSIAVYHMERFRERVDALGSPVGLCEELDGLLRPLQGISFPSQEAARAEASPARESVRDAIHVLLTLALDPHPLPIHMVSTRTHHAIEALVATVSCLDGDDLLRQRLHPLLILLTFNRYYGGQSFTQYQFR